MTRSIVRKELAVMWTSPVPYVLGALLNLVLGALGTTQVVGRGQAVFQPIVPIAGFLLLVASPVLCARMLAEESRTRTLDTLLAIPVPAGRLVAGKYLACLLTTLVLIAPVGAFAVLLAAYGSPDPAPIATGLLGLTLLAAALTGVGLLASSLTSSQPLAAAGGLLGVLLLWFAHVGSSAIPAGSLLASLSVSERLRGFAGGAVDLSDVVFLVSLALGAVAVAVAAVDARRLR